MPWRVSQPILSYTHAVLSHEFAIAKEKRLKYSHERRYNTGGCMSISGISFAHIQPVSL
jgi:hypothetical protein